MDKIYYQHSVDFLKSQFGLILTIILVIVLLGVFNTVSLSVLDRRHEIGVLRANGESLYKQDEAANETGKSFYPRRYLLGALSLQLTKDLAVGEYTIALRIRDLVGKQQSETKHVFRVE